MCIAIALPGGAKISKERLRTCYINNPHGAGFAYIQGNEVVIDKGFFGFESFWYFFNQIQEKIEGPKLIHFRIATSGGVNVTNCHPWGIDKKHALIHNGIVSGFSTRYKFLSDTGAFVEDIIKPMFKIGEGIFKEEFGKWMIEESIGLYNKMVILSAEGDLIIYNESQGWWREGAWYSNYSFTPKTYFPPVKKKEEQSSKGRSTQWYRKIGETAVLKMVEINELNHANKCKLIDLVNRKIVEVIPEENSLISVPFCSTEEFWNNVYPKLKGEKRAQANL